MTNESTRATKKSLLPIEKRSSEAKSFNSRAKETFLDAILRRKLFPLPVILLAFPTLAILFGSIGFLCNCALHPLAWWLGFFGALLLALIGGVSLKEGLKRMGWFVLTLSLVFLLDQSFIFFSWWDTQAYHIPAAHFLTQGWNPIFDSTSEALIEYTGANPESFNLFHVAYLPRAGWIWNALCYFFTGNSEAGDTLTFICAIALASLTWRITPIFFGPKKWKRYLFTAMTILSPGIYVSLFCGAHDGALYALLLIFMFAACAYRKTGATEWVGYLILAPIIGSNLKFTGLINFLITAFVFTLPILWSVIKGKRRPHKFWKWIVATTLGFSFALLVGISPYLTNWVNKGGPFYPEQTFSKDIPTLQMTEDFNLCNTDAKELNYFTRMTRAYFSRSLTDAYYQHKINREGDGHLFNPIFHLDQVDGLGRAFRMVMCLTLVILCFTRRCTTPWLLISLTLTSFIVPTKMMGYVRYVPQLWAVPMIIAFNAMTANVSKSPWIGRTLGIFIITTLCSVSILVSIGKLFLSLATSAYALSIVEEMNRETNPRLYILSREDRYRADGRCLAAWRELPENIPSKHLFDQYYHILLRDCGINTIHWQTTDEMRRLNADVGHPRFTLNEHLWYWPENPSRIVYPEMNYYCGHPRKQLISIRNIWSVTRQIIPGLPRYLWRISAFRLRQFHRHHFQPSVTPAPQTDASQPSL